MARRKGGGGSKTPAPVKHLLLGAGGEGGSCVTPPALRPRTDKCWGGGHTGGARMCSGMCREGGHHRGGLWGVYLQQRCVHAGGARGGLQCVRTECSHVLAVGALAAGAWGRCGGAAGARGAARASTAVGGWADVGARGGGGTARVPTRCRGQGGRDVAAPGSGWGEPAAGGCGGALCGVCTAGSSPSRAAPAPGGAAGGEGIAAAGSVPPRLR